MGKFKKKLHEIGDKDIDSMNLLELRSYIRQQIAFKAKQKLNDLKDSMTESDDDDIGGMVMEPKPKYKANIKGV